MAQPTGLLQRLRDSQLVWPCALGLVGLAILVALGSWQMARKVWKDDLIAAIAARGAMVPLGATGLTRVLCPPPDAPDPEMSCQFIPVRLSGAFDHARERHIFGTGVLQPGRPAVAGYFVMTPFRVAGASDDIVVNRGFVPEERKAPETRREGQLSGTVEITGLTRRAQPRSTFDATDDPRRNTYFVRDPVLLELVPAPPAPTSSPEPLLGSRSRAWLYVDLAAPTPPGGLPRPLPGPAGLTNRHFEYALTWYGLAATLVGVFLAFARSRLRIAPGQ